MARSRSPELGRRFERAASGLWLPRYAPRAPQYRHGFDGPRRVIPAGGGGLSVTPQGVIGYAPGDDTVPPYSFLHTPSSNLTSGSTLVGVVWSLNGLLSGVTVADATNGAWTSRITDPGGYVGIFTFINNASSGKPTVTITHGNAYDTLDFVLLEAPGASTSNSTDATASATNGYGADMRCGSLTLGGGATDLVVGAGYLAGNPSAVLTPDAGFSIVNFVGSVSGWGVVYQLTSTSPINPGGTINTSGGCTACALAVKP